MAEVVNETISREKYPWDKWTDGQTWVAVEGADFDISPSNFRAQLHVKATKLENTRVTTAIRGDRVIFQFSKKDDEEGNDNA